jgi:hypothetical protein
VARFEVFILIWQERMNYFLETLYGGPMFIGPCIIVIAEE